MKSFQSQEIRFLIVAKFRFPLCAGAGSFLVETLCKAKPAHTSVSQTIDHIT